MAFSSAKIQLPSSYLFVLSEKRKWMMYLVLENSCIYLNKYFLCKLFLKNTFTWNEKIVNQQTIMTVLVLIVVNIY